MSAFGRAYGSRLWLPQAVGAVAAVLAASLASADGLPTAWRAPAGGGAPIPLVAPEAPPSFGDIEASPLLSMFNAARAGGDGGSGLSLFAAFKTGFVPAAEISASTGAAGPAANETATDGAALSAAPSSPDGSPPPVPEPAAPPLSPMQGALQAATERLVAESDQPNPLGAGDWRAARTAIAFFYAARDYEPVWVGADGLTQAGRAALAQLKRARDDGLNLAASAAAARDRRRPRPRRARRSRDGNRLGGRDLCRTGDRIAHRALPGFSAHRSRPDRRRPGRGPRRDRRGG